MIVFSSPKIRLFCIVFFPLLFVRYAFHVLFWQTSGQKAIITEELSIQVLDYRFFHDVEIFRKSAFARLLAFLWAVHYNVYFLSLFYGRIGSTRSWICSWFRRERSSFELQCATCGVLHLFHPFGTIINAERVGNNVRIRNNTTIGNKNGRRPVIGDNVEIGANVVIIGGVTVGDNAVIGAGSVVVKDVPSDSVVAGNPARVIRTICSSET